MPTWPEDPAAIRDLGGAQFTFAVEGVRVIVLDLRTWAGLPGGNSDLIGPPGSPQDHWLDAVLAQPEREIILCSSLTMTRGTSWIGFPAAYERLLRKLADKKVLVLSGDIHVNCLQSHANPYGRFPIHEATSSGLAIDGYKLGYFGKLRNSGQVEIDDDHIAVSLFRNGDKADRQLTFSRATWA